MIQHRLDPSLFTTQPVHAALAGQLSRKWLNSRDRELEAVKEEIVLGVTLHDSGWMEWDQRPLPDPESGLPYDFMNTPTSEHLAVWKETVKQARSLPPLAEWLILVHHGYLAGIHDSEGDTDEEAAAVQSFYEGLENRRNNLADYMSGHDFYQHYATEDYLEKLRRLMLLWDYLSLLLCMDFEGSRQISQVPVDEDWKVLNMQKRDEAFYIEPWPFGMDSFDARLASFRLTPASSREELHKQIINSHVEIRRISIQGA